MNEQSPSNLGMYREFLLSNFVAELSKFEKEKIDSIYNWFEYQWRSFDYARAFTPSVVEGLTSQMMDVEGLFQMVRNITFNTCIDMKAALGDSSSAVELATESIEEAMLSLCRDTKTSVLPKAVSSSYAVTSDTLNSVGKMLDHNAWYLNLCLLIAFFNRTAIYTAKQLSSNSQ